MTDYERVMEAAAYIRGRTTMEPRIGLILGSGLGGIVEHMTVTEMIPYEDIPGFPASRVAGHAARLVFGYLGDQAIVAMQGRFHFYEGHSMRELCFPIFVLRRIGVENLIVTNACGGINTAFTPGDLMLITDHINLLGNNPLIGPNDERFGPRFPDMTEVYSRRLLRLADETAERLEIPVRHGVYALFPGPCYETAAEIRAYRVLGADAIGMSTVPETTAARYLGMEILGIACITNMATGIAASPHSHEEVLAVAEMSSRKLCAMVEEIIGSWPAKGR